MKEIVALIGLVFISHTSPSQIQKRTEMLKINGIDLHYEVYGEGEPLLLLHGWTQSSQFWKEYISSYAQHYKVYALDLRGHGKSTPIQSDFSIKKASDDVLVLLDHLEIETAKAIGLSYGALALLELASSNPDRIQSMVVIGASHNYNGADNTQQSFSYDNLPKAFIAELKKTHQHGEKQIRALFNPKLNYSIKLSEEQLRTIDCKTLIVHGDQDEILGIDPAFVLHKNLPNSQLWIVPNTGHLAITGDNLDDFLNKSLQFFMLD